MVYYRLYHISDAHFCRVEEFNAEDDLQAVRQAGARLATGAAELWCGKRRVKTFGQQPPAQARRTEPAETSGTLR